MFYETSSHGVSYYSFSELEAIPGFRHAFTSRRTDSEIEDATPESEVALSKRGFLDRFGVRPSQVIALQQSHSDRVLRCREAKDSTLESPHRLSADGVLLEKPGRWAVVRAADCLPILLVAPRQRKACLLHAGWRGTCAHIVRAGADSLLLSTLADPSEILAAIGPGIRKCCYEVGEEVRDQFASDDHNVGRLFEGDHLDLIQANRADLIGLGIHNIFDSGVCTSCCADRFYSWRRKRDAGRIWALAGFDLEES